MKGEIMMTILNHVPITKVEMLIRKPVEEVFEAFIDPAITSRFWFTKSSGRLETRRRVQWDWEMYGVSANVDVKKSRKTSEYSSNLVTTPRSSGFLLLGQRVKLSSLLQTQGLREMGMTS
jgi:hypothetical protein